MKWYPVVLEALPRWIPQRFLPAHFRSYTGERVEKRVYFYNRLGNHFASDELVYRLLGTAWDRDGYIYVAERWYWFARLELFLQSALHFAVTFLIRQGFLRSAVEGDWFYNFRFDPPDLWGTPVRRHERHEPYAR